MPPKQPSPKPAAPKRELSEGARIGRAITKLQALNEAEAAELQQSPAAIRAKYDERRTAALVELSPAARAAVVAAIGAAKEVESGI